MAPLSSIALAFAALLSSAICMPAPTPANLQPRASSSSWPNPHHRVLTLYELQTKQPLDGLPSNSNVTLFASTLGIGHQNYTCNGTKFVQTELGDGALANLYDTTTFLEHNPKDIRNLAQKCNFESCKYPSILNDQIGLHYFSAAIQPTFNLSNANPPSVLSGVKDDDLKAPNSALNVDWLYLTANPTNGISQNLEAVYRIDTFRGVAPTSCSTVGQQTSLPYAAQYWFYT